MVMHLRYSTIEFELKDALLVSIELNNESKTVGKSLYFVCTYADDVTLLLLLYADITPLRSHSAMSTRVQVWGLQRTKVVIGRDGFTI